MWPGKSFDTHGPIGAWVVTADEVDPAGLGIRTWVDVELCQDRSAKEWPAWALFWSLLALKLPA
jgi:2-keto-4-pentenoate hydratase/2-oxohepta-3-ene-1,7-dioic acid hydratase in catechol pathway